MSSITDPAAVADPVATPDPALAMLVRQVENESPIPIRLVVRGVSLSGHLVSSHDYFKSLGNAGPRPIRQEFSAVHSARCTPITEEAKARAAAETQADAAAYFHLREEGGEDARVSFWRGRLSAVDAWSVPVSSKNR